MVRLSRRQGLQLMLAARFGAIAAAGEAAAASPVLLGSWPLSETSGNSFADAAGANNATLSYPSWSVETAEWHRHGIVAGQGDHALEISNHALSIPMAAGYRQAAMSLVVYVNPLGRLRGTQVPAQSDQRYGREFLAFCDDGSTPGSFAIERRLNPQAGIHESQGEHRLDGYVRDNSGTAIRFSGGLSGISGALLPTDTSRRIVLTQGPAGAELWLDDVKVGSIPGVTQGWSSLTTPILIGSGVDLAASLIPEHANNRSPFWGRIDDIRVYQGQLTASTTPAVPGLPAALQKRLWRWPSDFNPASDINIADHASPQAAMDAASAAGKYLYQDIDGEFGAANTTTYAVASKTALQYKANCKGMLGVRIRFADGVFNGPAPNPWDFGRLVFMGNADNGQMGAHGDPYAGSGGYKMIGCRFDGNARGQSWHPSPAFAGTHDRTGFQNQQVHNLRILATGSRITVKVDACEFYESMGDGLSLYQGSNVTATSCRYFACIRGAVVVNDNGEVDIDARRFESLTWSPLGGYDASCGICDIEPFGPFPSRTNKHIHVTFADAWADGDLDDENRQETATQCLSRYYNVHTDRATFYLINSGASTSQPVDIWEARGCTIGYHWHGAGSAQNWPPAWHRGKAAGPGGVGTLFEKTVFLASGKRYYHHDLSSYPFVPDNNDFFRILVQTGNSENGRVLTLRDCEFRTTQIPAGTPIGNVQTLQLGNRTTARSIELDGVRVDAAFADLPFTMAGITVRYRNVLHERTGNTTPWTGAGAEIAL